MTGVQTCALPISRAHLSALMYLEEGGDSDVFNLGIGEGFSVRDVIEAAGKVTGREIRVVEAPGRQGDPPVLIADSTKARKVLNWKPEYSSLEKIIASAWEWHRKRFFRK